MRVVGAWKKFIILLNFKKCLWTSSWIWNTNTFRLPSSSPPLSIISFFSHSKILAQNITNGQNGSSCCFMGAWRKPEKSQNDIPNSVKKIRTFCGCKQYYKILLLASLADLKLFWGRYGGNIVLEPQASQLLTSKCKNIRSIEKSPPKCER